MANSLLHSTAEVVRQLLVDLGYAAAPAVPQVNAWPIYVGSEPDGAGVPDNVLSVYDTQGGPAPRFAQTGELGGNDGFLVRIRASDYQTGWRKGDELQTALAEHPDLVRTEGRGVVIASSSYAVYGIVNIGAILRLGLERGGRRWLFTVNAELVVEQLS